MRVPSFFIVMLVPALATCLARAGSGAETLAVHVVGLDYPRQAHMAAVQGTVELEIAIRGDGTVGTIKTLSGNGLLAGAASETLKTWRFSPCADPDGACRYLMTLHFVLKGGPLDISQCKTKFAFDSPGVITVESQFAKAIFD